MRLVSRMTDLYDKLKNEHFSAQAVNTSKVIDKIYAETLLFLERSKTIFKEDSMSLMEKLFIYSKGRPYELKQRYYLLFEKYHGPSLYKKMQWFLQKHIVDNSEHNVFFYQSQQIFDFLLFNFRTDTPLSKLKHTSKLFAFNNSTVKFDCTVTEFNEG